MSLFVVDVEADGPIPGDFSMLSFAAVKVDKGFEHTFLSAPLRCLPGASYVQEAIHSIGLSYDLHQKMHVAGGISPIDELVRFEEWIFAHSSSRPIFMSDNNGFDWMFMCWYFHHFIGHNPFGYSSRRIGDLYCGIVRDMRSSWKHLRKTKHTHNPLDDAKGNAEVVLHMLNNMELK